MTDCNRCRKQQNEKKEGKDMELCYEGGLVMPSSYAMMDEEEMTYVEGGGTFSINISARAVQSLLSIGISGAVGVIVGVLSANAAVGVIVGVLAQVVCDYIFNNVWTPKAIHKSWTKSWLPNFNPPEWK